MLRYVLKRLLTAIPTLFIIVTISFFLIRVAPGGPFDLERPLDAKVMENLNKIYQLDKKHLGAISDLYGQCAQGRSGPKLLLS